MAIKRIKITVNGSYVDADLINFSLPITLGASVGITNSDVTDIFNDLGSNYSKIKITEPDETTQLYVEVSYWDSVAEKAELWVSRNNWTVSGTQNTILYLYYSPEFADNTDYVAVSNNRHEVWDTYYKGVYHMTQDPSGSAPQLIDSTQNNYHCTSYGTMLSGSLIDSDLGKAVEFDGSNDYFLNSSLRFVTSLTMSVKFYVPALGRAGAFTHQGDNTIGGSQGTRLSINAANTLNCSWYSGAWRSVNSTLTISQGYNVVHIRVNSSGYLITFNINGNQETINMGYILINSTYPFKIGAIKDAAYANFFLGSIDDFSISSNVRSDAWIKASYYAQSDNLLTIIQSYVGYFEGFVTLDSVAVSRIVRLYNRSTGMLVDETTSSVTDGYYILYTPFYGYHYIVALDDDVNVNYNALISDRLSVLGEEQ